MYWSVPTKKGSSLISPRIKNILLNLKTPLNCTFTKALKSKLGNWFSLMLAILKQRLVHMSEGIRFYTGILAWRLVWMVSPLLIVLKINLLMFYYFIINEYLLVNYPLRRAQSCNNAQWLKAGKSGGPSFVEILRLAYAWVSQVPNKTNLMM